MGNPSAAERSLAGRVGAYIVHSRYDGLEITAAAREAFRSKFERDVDPDRILPEAERLRRAEMARKAHFAKLALKSAQARRRRRERRDAAIARRVAETTASSSARV